METQNQALIEMPKYKSHKEVWALKIEDIVFDALEEGTDSTSTILSFEEEGYAPIAVDAAYVEKHSPQIGGYYVIYADGYASWSPAEVFEEGYSEMKTGGMEEPVAEIKTENTGTNKSRVSSPATKAPAAEEEE